MTLAHKFGSLLLQKRDKNASVTCGAKIQLNELCSIGIHQNHVCCIKTCLHRWQPLLINFQNDIIEMDVAREGVERGRGQSFIRWSFEKRLGKIIINLGFYISCSYTCMCVCEL